MHLENEGWALCPVKPTFKVLQLKEFRAISLTSAPLMTSSTLTSHPMTSSNLTRSPKKSVKEYTETVEDDLVAPFDHYLDESIMEEDFMIGK